MIKDFGGSLSKNWLQKKIRSELHGLLQIGKKYEDICVSYEYSLIKG